MCLVITLMIKSVGEQSKVYIVGEASYTLKTCPNNNAQDFLFKSF